MTNKNYKGVILSLDHVLQVCPAKQALRLSNASN